MVVTRRRNPFRVFERVAALVGYVLMSSIAALAFGVVGFAIVDYYAWGWWALLLIPGIPIALVLLAIAAGLVRLLGEMIHDWWLLAKWRWDDRHEGEQR